METLIFFKQIDSLSWGALGTPLGHSRGAKKKTEKKRKGKGKEGKARKKKRGKEMSKRRKEVDMKLMKAK